MDFRVSSSTAGASEFPFVETAVSIRFGPEADICSAATHVCFGPIADILASLGQFTEETAHQPALKHQPLLRGLLRSALAVSERLFT